MKKLLSKGKVIVSFVSVFAILAVSMLSMFAGVTLFASAEDEAEETVTYPLNGSYDNDYVGENGTGATYTDAKGTKISDFTGFATDFITYAKGSGTVTDPYIIETANEFAAVVTGNLYVDGELFSTQYNVFKVDESIREFNLSNTNSQVDFSADMTAAEVRAAFESNDATIISGLEWKCVSAFMGQLNGNGVTVYGLKSLENNAGLIPYASYSVAVSNITVKNSYFCGSSASAIIAYNDRPDGQKHTIINYNNLSVHNNVVLCNNNGESIDRAGVLFGYSSVNDGSEMRLNNSLVYDNIAEHTSRKITYGAVGRLHRQYSATIKNSIIMDSVPHTLYYGSNAFHNSSFTNVYTNMCDGTLRFNYDGVLATDANGDYIADTECGGYKIASGNKYSYKYLASSEGSSIEGYFNGYYASGTNFVNNGSGYHKKDIAGPMYNVDKEALTTGSIIDGLDSDKWTFNAGSYPTPKVYNQSAYEFFEGDGSLTTPYVLVNVNDLVNMLVTDNTNMNYKLARDIELNDTSAADWTKNAKRWFTSNDVPEFKGTLDGNGKSISGIYYDGSQKGEYAGLIPVIGSPAQISKLTIKDSSLTANSGAVGALGNVGEKAQMIVKFDAVTIKDTVEIKGNAVKGGIVGRIGFSVAQFNNCISLSNGIFGESTGLAKMNSCISVDSYPFVSSEYIEAQNIYTNVDGDKLATTDADGNVIENLTVLDTDLMKGDAAKENMAGLGFAGSNPSWIAVANDYPAPTGAEASAEGAKGQVWSGAIATKFAGGSGTASDPFLIETAEQLALCIYNGYSNGANNNGDHFKLTADIYLNDVNGPMWADKIGCNQWYTQRTTKQYGNFTNCTLDGDGYVVYGLFYDHTGPQAEYVRVGLIPQAGEGTVVKNLAISDAFLNMNWDISSDCAGAIIGCVGSWGTGDFTMDTKNATGNKAKRENPNYWSRMAKVINCLVEDNSYISADQQAGGIVGYTGGFTLIENCVFTGSLKKTSDQYYGGTIVGVEWSHSITVRDVVSFSQTNEQMVGGNGGQTWRTGNDDFVVIDWDDAYYFSTFVQRCANDEVKKIIDPANRVGDLAVEAMPDLDWVDEYDQDYYDADEYGYTYPLDDDGKYLDVEALEAAKENGDATTMLAIEGGTPVPSIFAKHRDESGLLELSDTDYETPTCTLSFMTNADDVDVPDMVGKIYEKLELPTVTRDGYIFKGWHVFDDLTMLYPKDYFPPMTSLTLFAEWESNGIAQNFENYTDTLWDYDSDCWRLNKPGAKGGYKNAYVRNGAKSMHLLDTNVDPSSFLVNYEDMLEPGQAYTIKFWVTTDKADNPATLLTLVHNEKPVYLDTEVAAENMAVATGLKVGEWVQYSYSFTAQTKWISIRATGGSSLYFDDIVVGKIDGTLNGGNLIGVGTGSTNTLSPSTGDAVTVAVLVSALMACAVVAVISKKNLVEVID